MVRDVCFIQTRDLIKKGLRLWYGLDQFGWKFIQTRDLIKKGLRQKVHDHSVLGF